MTQQLSGLDPTGPPVVTLVRLRPDLRTYLDLSLYSEFEGKVPYGSISGFFNSLLERYFLGTEPILPFTQPLEETQCQTPPQQLQLPLSPTEDSPSANFSQTTDGASES